MKSLNEAMKNLQKSKIIKENNLKSKKSLKTESKDPTYIVCSYYDEKLHGLEDELKTDDWSEVEDFAHRKLMQGNMLEIENTKTGKYRRINPDEYDETFDGEFLVRPEELEEAEEDAKTKSNDNEYNYMLLSRLKQDCDYFLKNGNRAEKHLWAGNVDGQIAKMKELYNKLPKKPEWLSMEDIENYEKEMKQDEKTELNESLEMDEAIKTGVLNYLDEYNTENLMDYGSDEDAIGGMNSISKMFEDILRDILKINFVNVSTVDGISDGKYVTTIDFGDKTLDLDIRASEEKDDILEDVKTIIDFYNKNIENLTEDVGTMTSDEYNYMLLDRLKQDCEYYLGNGNRNAKYLWAGNEDGQIAEMRKIYNQLKEKPEWLTIDDINNYAKEMGVVELPSTTDGTAAKTIEDTLDRNRNRINEEISTPDEYILNEVKKALIERGIDIDLMHETCSELNLTSLMRKIIHYVLSGINFSINEYVYGEDFDVTLDNKLNLSIDMFEDLDEDKEVNKSTITITPAERKILNAVKTVNSKYDLSNIKLETTPDGATHIMSTKGEDIVTIKPLSDDEKEDLRLNGYYINN